ncbi:Metalloenzyme, LuxS/M16 peptidase-like protein [Flagelloscypha sp. PMI_526]|nr:Metalloenzyme, LuxS/M16 peptidase-like protein [Flagelloscypha sp. PMI_526]
MATHGFDLIKSVDLDTSPPISLTKYRSPRTGLSVMHISDDCPIVRGYFAVGTEIFNDSGCPHTLEHLVFMGSKKYPYKGVLDRLANRAFSGGTNAWTATDHTAYTLSTAGEQGFLQLLPIYLDHILSPILTDSGFITEVHHINAKGEDSGVVYSEMQGRQNTPGDLMNLCTRRVLEPRESAYRSETGGLMENLRILTINQIREYHATTYVPHNMCIIVTGNLPSGTSALLHVLEEHVELALVEQGFDKGFHPPGWKRPFLETPSAIRTMQKESIEETVKFPEQDESVGELMIVLDGPPRTNFLEKDALEILGNYLTSSNAAPLTKEFVDIKTPLCTSIGFGQEDRGTMTNLSIYVSSIPIGVIDRFPAKLKSTLERIAQEGLDMKRMEIIISRELRLFHNQLETSKGDALSSEAITDFLYGDIEGVDLEQSMNIFSRIQLLNEWNSDQWVSMLRQYYIGRSWIVIKGKPSASLAKTIEATEKKRIAAQVKKLGPEGLEKAAALVESAKKEHDEPVPSDIVTSFSVPEMNSISWIHVLSVQEPGEGRDKARISAEANKLSRHIQADGVELPFFVQYDHVESQFVEITAMFSLARLPPRLRLLLSPFIATFFQLPVHRLSGARLNHEEVANALNDGTVSYSVDYGYNGNVGENLTISISAEIARYDDAVAWLRDLVYGAQFDQDRLKVVFALIQQSLPELKRDENYLLSSLRHNLLYDESSSYRAGGVLQQIDAVPALIKAINERPVTVVTDFEELRKLITDPSGVRFSVAGNILAVKQPRSTLGRYFNASLPKSPLSPLKWMSDVLSPLGRNPEKQVVVLSLPSLDSGVTRLISKCFLSHVHPDNPAMYVTLQCLNAIEGHIWRSIRGSGLAYGADFSADNESGFLSFSLSQSSNTVGAIKAGAAVIQGLVDDSLELDDHALDAAKSSLIYSAASGLSTVQAAASASFVYQAIFEVAPTWYLDRLKQYQQVTKDDVIQILKKYFLALFDSTSSIAVVVTAPAKAKEIGAYFTEQGYTVEQKKLETEHHSLKTVVRKLIGGYLSDHVHAAEQKKSEIENHSLRTRIVEKLSRFSDRARGKH